MCVCVSVCVYHSLFIHSSEDVHLGYFACFHVLATLSSAAVNTGVHVSFQIMVFSSYMPRSRIAGSYDSSVLVFKVGNHPRTNRRYFVVVVVVKQHYLKEGLNGQDK